MKKFWMTFWAIVIALVVFSTLHEHADPEAFARGWNRGVCLGTEGIVCP